MAEITELIITKKAVNYWVYTINGEPTIMNANAYTGTLDGDYLTIKTRTGAVLVKDVVYSVVQYVDELDGGNSLLSPSSGLELQGHLIAQDFYEGSTGGGTGGITTFKGLLDTNVPSFIGKAGYAIVIDAAGQFLEAVPLEITQNNVGRYLDYGAFFTGSIPEADPYIDAEEMAIYLNSLPTPITVGATETPVYISGVRNGNVYMFDFLPGAGTWGFDGDGELITADMLVPFTARPLTTGDVENGQNGATIISLGDLPTGDYITAINAQGVLNWSDAGEIGEDGFPITYYISFTQDEVLYLLQYIEQPPADHDGDFVGGDFTLVTDSNVTPEPGGGNVESVTGTGVDNTDPANPVIAIGVTEVIDENGTYNGANPLSVTVTDGVNSANLTVSDDQAALKYNDKGYSNDASGSKFDLPTGYTVDVDNNTLTDKDFVPKEFAVVHDANVLLENLLLSADEASIGLYDKNGMPMVDPKIFYDFVAGLFTLAGTTGLISPSTGVTDGNFGIKSLAAGVEVWKVFNDTNNWFSAGYDGAQQVLRAYGEMRQFYGSVFCGTRFNSIQVSGSTTQALQTFALPTNTQITIGVRNINTINVSGLGLQGNAQFTVKNISGTLTNTSQTGETYGSQYSQITSAYVTSSDTRFDIAISGTNVILNFYNTAASNMNVQFELKYNFALIPEA